MAPDARAALVAEACGGDASLRAEAESLLRAHEAAAAFLEDDGGARAAAALLAGEADAADMLVGQRVGPYRVLAVIGRGGMGAVYLAQRDDDAYRKDVALKLVPAGAASQPFLARFRRERQILARLEHPAIARLLDGGATPDGRPYFAMEYVDGVPIDVHCRRAGLSTRARLELFRSVCAAVQHAHGQLIVHRDLKPGNILVSADGAPKLLDFGIAKLLAPEPGEADEALTATGLPLMTPEYASPEQVRGEPVGVAADVYALGVLLYELLTGARPYRFRSRSPEEIVRVVCHQEPAAPSTRVGHPPTTQPEGQGAGPSPPAPDADSAAAGERAEEPLAATIAMDAGAALGAGRRELEGDLDMIVLKALRKEPERRYASVEQLSEDIRRHLEGLPVLARKDTLGYRAGKFVRRNRVAVAAAGLVSLSLVGGILATARQAQIARRQQTLAERRAAEIQHLASSLVFELHDAIATLPGATRARALLLERAVRNLDALAAEAPANPALLEELASAYHRLGAVLGVSGQANLGRAGDAIAAHRKGLALRERLAQAAPEDLAARAALVESEIEVAFAEREVEPAFAHARRAVELGLSLVAARPEDPAFRHRLADAHYVLGSQHRAVEEDAPAFEEFERASRLYESLPTTASDPELQGDLARCRRRLGAILVDQGRASEALAHLRRALELDEARLARAPGSTPVQRDASVASTQLGAALVSAGQADEAMPHFVRAVALRRELVKLDAADRRALEDLGVALWYLGKTQRQLGALDEAVTTLQEAARIATTPAADAEQVSRVQSALAVAYAVQGRDAEAAAAWRQALRALRREVAARPDNPSLRRQLFVNQEGYAGFLGERAARARPGSGERAARCVEVREAYAAALGTAATLAAEAGERQGMEEKRTALRSGPARWGCSGA